MEPIHFNYFMKSGIPFMIDLIKISKENDDITNDIINAINNFINKMEKLKIKIIIKDDKIDLYETNNYQNKYICSVNIE